MLRMRQWERYSCPEKPSTRKKQLRTTWSWTESRGKRRGPTVDYMKHLFPITRDKSKETRENTRSLKQLSKSQTYLQLLFNPRVKLFSFGSVESHSMSLVALHCGNSFRQKSSRSFSTRQGPIGFFRYRLYINCIRFECLKNIFASDSSGINRNSETVPVKRLRSGKLSLCTERKIIQKSPVGGKDVHPLCVV